VFLADQPAEVVRGADVVITMLSTAPIVLDLVEPLLEDWPEETIWLQMSSVGASEADRLVEVARAHDTTLVDAPVSGSTHPAEEGELTILASGPDSARAPSSRSSKRWAHASSGSARPGWARD
jgi:3-hydroxyisobutyrate dehydrogenase